MKNRTILFLLLGFVFSQCRNEVEEPVKCATLELPQISYSVQVYPIVSETCAIPQCHTTDFEYGDFSQFSEFKKKADSGELEFVLDSRQMPHGFTDGPSYLDDCQIATIKKWIHEGAKNN